MKRYKIKGTLVGPYRRDQIVTQTELESTEGVDINRLLDKEVIEETNETGAPVEGRDRAELEKMNVSDLRAMAHDRKVEGARSMRKDQLVEILSAPPAEASEDDEDDEEEEGEEK